MATDEIEMSVTEAVRSRLSFFRKQSDSLTFEGVRRLLEKDLGLEAFSLDSHKKLIKALLQENFYSSEEDDASGNVKENENEAENSELENSSKSLESLGQNLPSGKHGKGRNEDNKLLKEKKQTESDIDIPEPREKAQTEHDEVDDEINGKNELSLEVTETVIKEAVLKRASYLRAEIESISLGSFRRLLEQDLRLETKALDVHKTLISKLVDELLTSPSNEPDNVKEMNKKSQKKKLSKGKKIGSEEDEVKYTRSDTMEDSLESTEISRDDGLELNKETLKASKSKKIRKKDLGIATLKGRKRKLDPENEHKKSVKKPKKKKSVEDTDTEPLKSETTRRKEEEDSVDEIEEPVKNKASEDSDSASSDNEEEKSKMKKTSNAVVHGEQVQNLKKIIRSCGMTVPPTVYKKAKQQPDSKREAYLLQELIAILKKEGLSTNPTDKEIKAVVKRKEKAKDLEGIDMTNIISDSRRRRATSNFLIPPPQYKVSNEDDEDSSDDEDGKSSEDDEPVIEEEESD
ncbi:hypothetical protein SUGI_0176180 [Cryptomeria japonica]|uniref:uncharacterized protein LOC131052167 n=1 Tax=Cryptomeria japonica TaxID=3369 RepID=UPI002408C55D|nr:uncharacterized protein LOC131052167 [Cryptomeria japonica]GLJ11755.1 hypothetical protein SUGI_0176180 [Cryptomeria japonica]